MVGEERGWGKEEGGEMIHLMPTKILKVTVRISVSLH